MEDLQSVISNSEFVDLYISNTFADVKGLAGADSSRVPVPEDWLPEIPRLLEQCRLAQSGSGGPEFSILFAGVVYRVTQLDSNEPGGMYVLRKSRAEYRPLRSIGIPRYFVDAILAPDAVGLLLICGGFRCGKTSTGASWLVDRLKTHGGISLSVEDPIETNTQGIHGNGRSIQVEASRHKGGFKEHLIRGLRSGVDFLFLGEIRDGETAFEALKAGSNGELIATTFHASDPIVALQRLIAMASEHAKSASIPQLLASALLGVLWLDLVEEPQQGNPEKKFKRLETRTLLVSGENAAGAREKIRNENISGLIQDIELQASQSVWGANGKR